MLPSLSLFFFMIMRQYMFFAGNLKNTTKYKENKNHPDPTTITLFKTTFLGIVSVSGKAQRHFWIRFVRKCLEDTLKYGSTNVLPTSRTDSRHSSGCAIVLEYKEDFRSSTALLPPLRKARGEILKPCQILWLLGAPRNIRYLLFGNTATFWKLSFRLRGGNQV